MFLTSSKWLVFASCLIILTFLEFYFCKVDSIFKDRSIGNYIKVETVKVMSLEGATFGYMRHGGSNKVNLISLKTG